MKSNPGFKTETRSLELFGAFPVALTVKDVVAEASWALARLDAERLEELACSCRALSGDAAFSDPEIRLSVVRQAREAAGEMAILQRVLESTRANLNVMNRLRQLRGNGLEYSESELRGRIGAEGKHGHD